MRTSTSRDGRRFPLPAAFLAGVGLTGLLLTGCGGGTGTAGQGGRPKGVDTYVEAVMAQKRGDEAAARAKLEAAVQINPELRMAQSMLGESYRAQGQYRKALPHSQAAARLDPYSVLANYNLGVVYQFLNRLEDSAKAYIKALDLDPRDLRSNMNLGVVYLSLGQNADAEHYLTRATKLAPDHAPAWSNLGVAIDAAGRLAEAEAVYRRALELDSSSLATLRSLAANLIAQGKPAEALTVSEQAVALSDTPVTRKLRGDALAAAKRYVEAQADYDAALKRDARYFPALNGKAALLIEQFKAGLELDDSLRTRALELWRQSLAINPKQPRTSETLKRWENPGLFAS